MVRLATTTSSSTGGYRPSRTLGALDERRDSARYAAGGWLAGASARLGQIMPPPGGWPARVPGSARYAAGGSNPPRVALSSASRARTHAGTG